MSTSSQLNRKPKSEWNMDDPKEVELYKLYRPEHINPKERGKALLQSPHVNKGMAFSLYERQFLGIHGLLPAAIMSQEQQIFRIMNQLRHQPDDLARYIQLDSLQCRDEKLYYRVLVENVRELMPIVYTPTVGLACQLYGFIYRYPKGVYITINDNSISKIYQILNNWDQPDIRVIVVTDGERILGLGDLGSYGIGIPVGKLALYVALAGVRPEWCLPVILDVGTNNQKLLDDPYYIGLRRQRMRGSEYNTLVDNFMKACVKKYGQKILIQFEDFANQNANRLLKKYQTHYCTFNDDIQGTACVTLAGLLATTRVTKRKIADTKFMFFGAGEAATGVADLLVKQMMSEGITFEQACNNIYIMNSKGLIVKSDTDISEEHLSYAKDEKPSKDLLELIKRIKPNALIGLSTVGGAFTEAVIKEMTSINDIPIIFSLSNPTIKSECTAEDAYKHSNGKALFASGSPFKDVQLNGKTFKPGQGNNAYVFPGIGLGVILFQVANVDSNVFLHAARTLAEKVSEEELSYGRLFPELSQIREISLQIALQIGEEAYKNGSAKFYPQPENMEMFIRSQIYSVEYEDIINRTYKWPETDMKVGFPVPQDSS